MIITLTSDFGYSDPFVGTMKGVLLGINPEVQVVDITHGIAAHDIKSAALALSCCFHYFPKGTIHIAVVDPEVGSDRRPILIQVQERYLIGPDNGVLSLLLEEDEPDRIIHLNNEAFHLHPKSRTFHGRDVFAPVAAHLSRGVSIEAFGEPLQDCARLRWPPTTRIGRSLIGEIIYIDVFGNLVTSIREHDLEGLAPEGLLIGLANIEIRGLSKNYIAGQTGNFIGVINSWGLLEIARYRESAARSTGAKIGDEVRLHLPSGQKTT